MRQDAEFQLAVSQVLRLRAGRRQRSQPHETQCRQQPAAAPRSRSPAQRARTRDHFPPAKSSARSYKAPPRNQSVPREHRPCAGALAVAKIQHRRAGQPLRLNQPQRPLGDPERTGRHATISPSAWTGSGAAALEPRSARAAPHEGDVVRRGEPAEQQRREVAQHREPARSAATGRDRASARRGWRLRRDDMGPGIEAALGGNHHGGAVLDAVDPDEAAAAAR